MRDLSIVIVKALCAIFIVMSACHITIDITHVSNLFIPSIFMVLGYFFNTKYWNDTRGYLSKRLTNLYLPFFFGGTIFIVFHNVFSLLCLTTPDIWGWQETFQRLLNLGFGLYGYDPILSQPLWLLRCMFVSTLVFYFITLAINNFFRNWTSIRVIEISVLIVIGLTLWLLIFKLSLPLFPNGGYTELLSIIFFGFGSLYQTYEKYIKHRTFLSVISIAILIAIGTLTPVSMTENVTFLSFIGILIGGLSGFLVMHHLALVLAKSNKSVVRSLEYFGTSWIYIIIFYPLFFKIVGFFHVLFTDLSWKDLHLLPQASETSTAMFIIYFICGCIFPILCVWGWRKADAKYNLSLTNCAKYLIYGIVYLSKLIWKCIKIVGINIWNNIKSFFLSIIDIVKASNPKDE